MGLQKWKAQGATTDLQASAAGESRHPELQENDSFKAKVYFFLFTNVNFLINCTSTSHFYRFSTTQDRSLQDRGHNQI